MGPASGMRSQGVQVVWGGLHALSSAGMTKLAPGEAVGGWRCFQWPTNDTRREQSTQQHKQSWHSRTGGRKDPVATAGGRSGWQWVQSHCSASLLLYEKGLICRVWRKFQVLHKVGPHRRMAKHMSMFEQQLPLAQPCPASRIRRASYPPSGMKHIALGRQCCRTLMSQGRNPRAVVDLDDELACSFKRTRCVIVDV
jgi:hypothetical protein